MAALPPGGCSARSCCRSSAIVLFATIVSLVVLDRSRRGRAAALAGALAVYLLASPASCGAGSRGSTGSTAVEGPEGVRIRRGLFQTVSETIPYGTDPGGAPGRAVLWRPLGWCRLEVDIAGATPRNQRGEGTG